MGLHPVIPGDGLGLPLLVQQQPHANNSVVAAAVAAVAAAAIAGVDVDVDVEAAAAAAITKEAPVHYVYWVAGPYGLLFVAFFSVQVTMHSTHPACGYSIHHTCNNNQLIHKLIILFF